MAQRDFFAYIGFDAVSTAARRPRIPNGTCRSASLDRWSSAPFCTSLCRPADRNRPIRELNVADPVALGIDATGVSMGAIPGEAGRHFGLAHGDAGHVSASRACSTPCGATACYRSGPAQFIPSSVRRGSRPYGGNFRGHLRRRHSHRHSGRTGEHRYAAGIRDRVLGSLDPARAPS